MQPAHAALAPAAKPLPFGLDKATLYPLLAFVALFATQAFNGERLLADPDTQWHVAIGREILRTWTFPTVDAWSHTFAGEPWIAKEWLSQVLFALSHDAAGWPGVVVLTALVTATTAGCLLAFLLRRMETRFALLAFLLATQLLNVQLLARPHVFFHLLLVAWLIGVLRAVERGRAPPLALALVMIPWANTHASFLIGLVLAGLLGLEGLLRAAPAERLGLALRWAAFGLAAFACTIVTPYGWTPLLVALSVFEEKEAILYVSEWRRLDLFGGDWIALVGYAGAAAGLLAIVRAPRRAVMRWAIVILCGAMAFEHIRFLTLFALVSLIVLAEPLAAANPRLAPVASRSNGETTRRAGALALATVAALAIGTLRIAVAPPPDVAPRAALEAARAAGVADGPVVNEYAFGGFLILEGVPTFIDGRSDQLFVGGFMHAISRALAAPTPDALLEITGRYGVDWALVEPGTALHGQIARAPGWEAVYRSADAEVWALGRF